jgi:hypothetical protein
MSTLVIAIKRDHGPGPPYNPCFQPYRLWRADKSSHGKLYYLTVGNNPASKTWLTDERAEQIIKDWRTLDPTFEHPQWCLRRSASVIERM